VPLRIAFDLDGVLADMESELARRAKALFGEAVARRPPPRAVETPASSTAATTHEPPADAADTRDTTDTTDTPKQAAAEAAPDNVTPLLRLNMTSRQQRKLWAHVESIENFWMRLEELEPGIVARLGAIAAERRWEVIFLTKRPQSAGFTAQVQSQKWLESKGFPLPSVFVVQGSRGRIAAALGLDIVIDDRPENCLDVIVDSKARAILVWRDDESLVPAATRRLGIGVVRSVGECLDILAQVDMAADERPGVMTRVMRLLGLKEPASA
jgi:hypothetical protein